jgi:hypothetical protein
MSELLENIKAAIVAQRPVIAEINGTPSVIIGYDDDRQEFLIRPCGGPEEWAPYTSLIKDSAYRP